jgi:hypothetical protein
VIARALTRSAGWATLRAVAPLWVGIAAVGAVLFGPQGMTAADVVRLLDASLVARVVLLGAWLLATAPAARAIFATPSTFYLRALPVARWRFGAVHAAHLFALQAPWILLHARGGGLVAAATAAAVAMGAHALLCARPGAFEALAGLALAAAVVRFRELELAAGLVAALVGGRSAFLVAPERRARTRRAVGGPAPVALALACLVAVPRRAAAAIPRALVVAAAGAAIAALAARNNELAEPSSVSAVSLGVLAVALPAALGGVLAALYAAEGSLRWLLDATGASRALRTGAPAGAAAAAGAACGLAHGAAVAIALSAGPALAARLVFLGGAWGASLGALGLVVLRRAERAGEKHRANLAVVFGIALGAAAAIAAGMAGELAVPGAALAAFVAVAVQAERA